MRRRERKIQLTNFIFRKYMTNKKTYQTYASTIFDDKRKRFSTKYFIVDSRDSARWKTGAEHPRIKKENLEKKNIW